MGEQSTLSPRTTGLVAAAHWAARFQLGALVASACIVASSSWWLSPEGLNGPLGILTRTAVWPFAAAAVAAAGWLFLILAACLHAERRQLALLSGCAAAGVAVYGALGVLWAYPAATSTAAAAVALWNLLSAALYATLMWSLRRDEVNRAAPGWHSAT